MNSKTKSRHEGKLQSPEIDKRSRSRKETHSSSDTGRNRYLATKKEEGYGDRKRRCSKDPRMDEYEGLKEKKRRKEGEEFKKGSRMYHEDRYWDRNDTGSHHEKGSNDRYRSKCLAPEGTRSRCGDSDSNSRGREKKVKSDDPVQNSNKNTKYDAHEGTVTNTSSPQPKKSVDLLTSRTGGAYIPPAKLRMMQAQITDKSSAAYQRIAWEALKKSIHGHINKVNTANIAIIVRELLKENIVRGRGLLCRSIIQAQAASPSFTHVYAALVAVINSKVRPVQQFVKYELEFKMFIYLCFNLAVSCLLKGCYEI
jgi:pre-mRNA-splicing factor CWC22